MTPVQVEEAILATLRAAAGGTAYAVERFDGRSGSDADLAAWIATVQLPAVAVFFAGATYDAAGGDEETRIAQASARFEVWLIADTLRGYAEALVRSGGIYTLLDKVFAALNGARCGVDIEPLQPVSELAGFAERETGRTVWIWTWATRYRRS